MNSEKINGLAIKLKPYWFYLVLASGFLALFTLLAVVDKLELLPPTFFSVITAVFSYQAYLYSKEKFRLDLFEKRWEIYEHVLEFCSRVTQQGTLRMREDNQAEIIAALNAAGNSFRGTGWHKTRALFGEEIHQLFERLNSSYAWMSAFSERPSDPQQSHDWPQNMYDHSMFIWNTVGQLPDLFKPYIYFGDYKKD